METFNRWPNIAMHLRNIDIAISVAKGDSYIEAYRTFNIVPSRIGQIYRQLMAHVCSQKHPVTFFGAMYDKRWYKHPDALKMLKEYKHNYILEKQWSDPKFFEGKILSD